eukprot:5151804-Alexandrium_andersonii.AAC.1
MLRRIDQRLRILRARPEDLFGGLAVLFTGDLYQLPPVKGAPMYCDELLWRRFVLCELEGNHLSLIHISEPTRLALI